MLNEVKQNFAERGEAKFFFCKKKLSDLTPVLTKLKQLGRVTDEQSHKYLVTVNSCWAIFAIFQQKNRHFNAIVNTFRTF